MSSARERRILIVEPHAKGHHATYLRWVVEAVTEQGWTAVVATTAEALEHPLLVQLERGGGTVELRTMEFETAGRAFPSWLEIIRGELVHWWALRRLVRAELARGRVAAVVLPYLDYCFFAFGVLGVPERRAPWHVISMRLSAVTGAADRAVPWKWRLARRLLSSRGLATLFAICPSVRHVSPGWLTAAMAARLRYLPDPAEHRGTLDRDAARAQLALRPNRVAVLVFGSIDERKGLARVVEALAGDPALESYVLVVAGKQSSSLRAASAAEPFAALLRQQRVIELDRVLGDAEQTLVFAAADVAWLGYDSHSYMSGVLVLAGLAGLPVVATDEGEVGAFVRDRGMGVLLERRGTESVSAALLALLDEPLRRRLGEQSRAAVAEHTPAVFKRALVAAIEASV